MTLAAYLSQALMARAGILLLRASQFGVPLARRLRLTCLAYKMQRRAKIIAAAICQRVGDIVGMTAALEYAQKCKHVGRSFELQAARYEANPY